MARVKKACGRGTTGVVGGAGGKVHGVGRARGTLAAMRGVACAHVRGGVRARAGWRAHARVGAQRMVGARVGWRGCTENGARACGVACAIRRCARRSGQRAKKWPAREGVAGACAWER